MPSSRTQLVAAVLLACLLSLGGCGGGGEEAALVSADVADVVDSPPPRPLRGGELEVIAASDVDSLDPGTTNLQFGYQIAGATQRQLLAWRPDDVKRPSPDLAQRRPIVSEDGLTITIALRRDVRFSPPVSRHVRCADFKYAIERSLLPAVANGYVATYLGDVRGFEGARQRAARAESAPSIPGIDCPDSHRLVIRLARSSSAGVLGALSLPLGAPVPRAYAEAFDAESPSAYAEHQVASGPYQLENDESGRVTGYEPGREIRLVRNPNWSQASDWRPAFLDQITVREGFAETASAARKILAGESMVSGDIALDPISLRRAAEDYRDQLELAPVGGTRYIPFNTRRPPFDDVNVRRAVIAASNREALRNTLGGELAGPVASHYLPPGIPGHQAAGATGPDLDFLAEPEGDSAVATRYMKRAGYPSGRCQGDCSLTMVGAASPPASNTAEVFASQVEQLGFEVDLHLVAQDVMYTRFCQVPANQPHLCPNMGWIKTFQDPQGLLQGAFTGDGIQEVNNLNWALLDDARVDARARRAIYVSDPAERARAWAEVDRLVSARAPAVPWNWITQASIRSGNVAGVINRFNASWDLSFTSLWQ